MMSKIHSYVMDFCYLIRILAINWHSVAWNRRMNRMKRLETWDTGTFWTQQYSKPWFFFISKVRNILEEKIIFFIFCQKFQFAKSWKCQKFHKKGAKKPCKTSITLPIFWADSNSIWNFNLNLLLSLFDKWMRTPVDEYPTPLWSFLKAKRRCYCCRRHLIMRLMAE